MEAKGIKKVRVDLDMSGEKSAGKKIADGIGSIGTIKTKGGVVKMDLLKRHSKESFRIDL